MRTLADGGHEDQDPDGTVTLLNPQPPVARLLDLPCVGDMISIRDRVTRDIRPGTSADGG